MKKNWTDKAIDQWLEESIELNQGASLHTIIEAEAALDYLFPADFKDLYMKVNGFLNWDWRPNMFSIWPLERIIEEYHNETNNNFIAFSDYLINSHQIGFMKDKIGIYILYGEIPDQIANSFTEIIELINTDSDRIY